MSDLLILSEIEKSFDDKRVLQAVSLGIAPGEIVVLLGPSGSGKTTLMRIIAGLETADKGDILWDGRNLNTIPVHRRGFGMVFQDYALFPHKNVFDNVAFGLKMQNWSGDEISERVTQMLALVGLPEFGERPIHELSGGEQQRVALARSLAPAPRLLLLDEPLGALDRALRERLMGELRSILKRAGEWTAAAAGITAVYVTHDQAEAFAIADRVVVMRDGRIEQQGSPTELHRHPATSFVAAFLGMTNIIEGEVLTESPGMVATDLGALLVGGEVKIRHHRRVKLLVRPEAGELSLTPDSPNICTGRLAAISFRGRYQIATICFPEPLTPSLPAPVELKLEWDTAVSLPEVGTEITLSLKPIAIQLLEWG